MKAMIIVFHWRFISPTGMLVAMLAMQKYAQMLYTAAETPLVFIRSVGRNVQYPTIKHSEMTSADGNFPFVTLETISPRATIARTIAKPSH